MQKLFAATALTSSLVICSPAWAYAAAEVQTAGTQAEDAGAQGAGAADAAAAGADTAQGVDEAGAGEIVVTGIRQSLERSIGLKKEAIGIRDSIVAEDIGKFPEANIADALVRLPGVELIKDDNSGEGREVRLRGLGAEFTVSTVNGAQVYATTPGSGIGTAQRSLSYDLFPSELFGRIDVYKTPLAELTEGGVAGVVDLRTPRPMDFKDRVIRYTLATNFNDVSRKTNPRGHILFSDRFLDGKLGFLVSAAVAKADNSRSGFDASGHFMGAQAGQLGGGTASANRFDYNFAAPGTNLNGFTQADINNGFLPRILTIQANNNKRQRIGVTSSLQYSSGPLDISLDGMYSTLKDETQRADLAFPIRDARVNPGAAVFPRDLRLIPVDVRVDENNNVQGTIGNVQRQNVSRYTEGETKYRYLALNGAYDVTDRLKITGQLSRGISKGYTTFAQIAGLTGPNFRDTITFDTSNPVQPTVSTTTDLLNPNNYGYIVYPAATSPGTNPTAFNQHDVSYSGGYTSERDRVTSGRLVASYDWDLGGLSGLFKTGVSISSNIKTVLPRTAPNLLNGQIVNGVAYSSLTREQKDAYIRTTLSPISFDDIAKGGIDTVPTSFLGWSRDFILGTLDAFNQNPNAPQTFLSTFKANEKITAVFAQTDLRTTLFGNDLRGNIGVRFVETDTIIDQFVASAASATGFAPVQLKGTYDNLLPSASAAYDLFENLVLRASWGKTLTRSSIRSIAAPISVPNSGNLFVNIGNPNLKPQRSESLDAAVEWYFARGGILAVTAFRKNIKDRALARTAEIPFDQLGIPATLFTANLQTSLAADPSQLVTAATFVNQEAYKVKGLEFFYQQQFRFLPEPFDGLGATGSLTLIDTGNQLKRIPDNATGTFYTLNTIPKRTYAVSVYWEKGPLAVRTSYNRKTESANFGSNDSNLIGFQRYLNPRGSLDASIAYKVLKNLELRLDGSNLTATETFDYLKHMEGKYGDPYSRVTGAFIGGRTYTLSVRGSF